WRQRRVTIRLGGRSDSGMAGAEYAPANGADQWVPDKGTAVGGGRNRFGVGADRGAESVGAAHRRTVDAAALLARNGHRAGQGRQVSSAVRVVLAGPPAAIAGERPAGGQDRQR